MRVLVIGAGGLLGGEIAARAPADVAVSAFDHVQLDLTSGLRVRAVIDEVRPTVVVNAAAYTAVDQAEAEPERAYQVNADAVGALGRVAAERGARVVHFSTDYVFDGTAGTPYSEGAPVNPINTYGRSKLAGEAALGASGAASLIIRTQWLYGPRGARSFARTMLDRARRRLATRVVDDQAGCPTYAPDLAEATWRFIESGTTGLLHVANSGVATWYEVAQRIFTALAVPELLTPCASSEYPTPAARPRYSVLDSARAAQVLGSPLPPWQDGLDRFLQTVGEAA